MSTQSVPLLLTALAVWVPGTPLASSQESRSPLETITAFEASPVPTCASHDGEIVVCGKSNDRYRIPRPFRSERPASTGLIRPISPSQVSDFAPCGIFQGERHCARNEAAQYGYGGGRNPIAVIGKMLKNLVGAEH